MYGREREMAEKRDTYNKNKEREKECGFEVCRRGKEREIHYSQSS